MVDIIFILLNNNLNISNQFNFYIINTILVMLRKSYIYLIESNFNKAEFKISSYKINSIIIIYKAS